MSERKNIKRNKNRPKAKDAGLVQSMQRSYYKPKEKVELTQSLFK